jgi:hypothetical protein
MATLIQLCAASQDMSTANTCAEILGRHSDLRSIELLALLSDAFTYFPRSMTDEQAQRGT